MHSSNTEWYHLAAKVFPCSLFTPNTFSHVGYSADAVLEVQGSVLLFSIRLLGILSSPLSDHFHNNIFLQGSQVYPFSAELSSVSPLIQGEDSSVFTE